MTGKRSGSSCELATMFRSYSAAAGVRVADLPEVNAPKVTVLREIQLVTLTPAIRAERNIRRANGALVQSVSPRVAEQLGIQAGDVILQVNRVPVADAESAARARPLA